MRHITLIALASSMLAAALPPPGQAAETPPPVVYTQKTASYQVVLRIDPALRRDGGVYASYRDAALREFNGFERMAEQMHAIERQGGGGPDRGPFFDEIDIRVALRTPHLIGLIRRTYQDRHGAHPDPGISAVILDGGSGRQISPIDLLRPGVDMAPLDAALQNALEQARAARADGHEPPAYPGGELATWDAGRMSGDRRKPPPSDVTLAPAAGGGNVAGGLQFVYGPYAVGPYVEGAYRVVLPASLFAADLKPLYRDDFKGEPAALPGNPLLDFPSDAPR